ncbi:hypothetical protein SAZ_26220 [Streptomyces noursei ZPM]|uniref:Uncharacterized protein n=1 Tax=Streptomyces noursei TaxID=1971 RepID=A0A059W6G3_STRNR|nr:hypothetical protein [Streptomyces noursei]AKA08849.1 hypothetical protein SAZ_26220 [Streptomyces noursei ZPM]AIA05380.1 hypothetical protein DC74_4908 [Streptomyces noursei]EPY92811.1 hypothetical protein K530_51285 [Streptomyces noursei CCRC 11814]MCZ0970800.1 hypothetical protein [Streptomyces noursei]UWS73952.1 hypothetical protein N1H47_23525 [Streptomyces noursei]
MTLEDATLAGASVMDLGRDLELEVEVTVGPHDGGDPWPLVDADG